MNFPFDFLFCKKEIKNANHSTRYLRKRGTGVNRSSSYFGKIKRVFLEKEKEVAEAQKRVPGSLKRMGSSLKKKYDIPANFNDPLEDLKEYM